MASLRLLSSSLKKASVSTSRCTFSTRNVHRRRALQYPIEEGVGKFLPPQALKVQVEWQDGLLERLNEEVKGTSDENGTIVQTVINTSARRENTLAFNYASLALNNSYFLDNIKPPPSHAPSHEGEIDSLLENAVTEQHGSLRQLKSSFSAATLGMFTNGWVWFVTDAQGTTGILPTFGPGTLLVRSRTYMGPEKGLALGDVFDSSKGAGTPGSPLPKAPLPGVSPAFPTSGVSSSSSSRTPPDAGSGARFLHTSLSSRQENFDVRKKASIYSQNPIFHSEVTKLPDALNVGETLYPLFCVPTYEHAWMSAGYGVWGKEEWLKEFWSVVDWAKVSKAYKRATGIKSLIQ